MLFSETAQGFSEKSIIFLRYEASLSKKPNFF